MTDIVIPLIRTTYDNHLELKYALRSMQASLIGVGKLILVGHRPNWCRPDVFVPYPDAHSKENKERNIAEKLSAAVNHATEAFLYTNDDHFLLKRRRVDKFPVYYSKTFGGSGNYLKTVENTRKVLGECLNYDLHCPIIINGWKFLDIMKGLWPTYGYCMKTLYAHGLPGVECEDLKIRNPGKYSLTGRDWFSTDNGALKGKLLREVSKLFPNKSKWEI